MKYVAGARAGSAARVSEQTLRDIALKYPEAYEEFPWGERALKVKKKVFLFLSCTQEGLGMSFKLPHSNREALLLPFATPTGYGLGKSGWVSAKFGVDEKPPIPILAKWIDESYRAVAPKKAVALLDAGAAPSSTARPKKKTATRKKPVAKKAAKARTSRKKA